MPYLIKGDGVRGRKVAHIWYEGDTACCQASQGRLYLPHFKVVDFKADKWPICRKCAKEWRLLYGCDYQNEGIEDYQESILQVAIAQPRF